MKYRVLALDLDGTLTNSKKVITEKTKSALMKAQQNGCILVLASGRPTYGIVPLAKELELAKYGGFILSYNGACIIDCVTDKPLYQQVLPAEMIGELVDFAKKEQVNLLSYEGQTVITENPDCPYTEIEARINHMPIQPIDDFKSFVTFPITKCLMLADSDYLATVEPRAAAQFGDRINVFRSEPFFLELVPQHIDKAFSLSKLLELLDMTRDELICCGDGFNDLSMIQYAGLGVAMANGQEPVKQAADLVTLSNDEDGLVPVIEQYLL